MPKKICFNLICYVVLLMPKVLWAQEVEINLWQPKLDGLSLNMTMQQEITICGEITAKQAVQKVDISLLAYYPDKITSCPVSLYYQEKDNKTKVVFRTTAKVAPGNSTFCVAGQLERGDKFSKTYHVPISFNNKTYADSFTQLATSKVHKDAVRSLQFSRNGRYLLSAGDDKNIYLLAPRTLAVLKKIQGHLGYVRQALFLPDEQQLVSCGDDRTVRLWEVSSGKLLHTFSGASGPLYSLAISPDGRHVAAGCRQIHIWDLQTKKEVSKQESYTQVRVLKFTSDGKYLMGCDDEGNIAIGFFEDKSVRYERSSLSEKAVTCLAVHPNRRYMYTGCDEGNIRWWQLLLNPRDELWEKEDHAMWEIRLNLVKNRRHDPADLTQAYIDAHFDDYAKISKYPIYNLNRKPADMETDKNVWYKKTERPYNNFEKGGAMVAMELNSTGEYLLFATAEGYVAIHETFTGKRRWYSEINHPLQSGTFAYDGSLASVADIYGQIWVYGVK